MTEIKSYAVRLNGGPIKSGDSYRAFIHLFNTSNKLVGIIRFYLMGEHKDKNENGIITFHLTIDRLHDTVDILRNEKPIYLGWQEKEGLAFISTSQEPVGEGE